MSLLPRSLSLPAAASFLLAVSVAPALAEPAPERLRLEYGIYAGGVHALDATLDIALGMRGYDASLALAPRGLFKRIAPWKSEMASSGRLDGGRGIAPVRHSAMDSWRGEGRTTRLSYDTQGAVTASIEPDTERGEHPVVPGELTRGSLDPVSAVLSMAFRLAAGEPCAGTVPVYDGRRRFDMTFVPRGTREVARSRYTNFSGTAEACDVSQALVAGKPFKKRFFDVDGPKRPPATMLLAPVAPGSLPVPVRVDMESGFGSLVMHLTKAERVVEMSEVPVGD